MESVSQPQASSPPPPSGLTVSPFAQQMESQLEVVTRKLGIQKEAVDRARTWGSERLGALRPWKTFFNFTGMRAPKSMDQAKNRVNRNLAYYQTNYMVVFFLMTLYLLLTNIMLLLSTVVIGGAYYYLFMRGETTFVVFGLPVSRGGAYAMFISIVIVLLYVSSAGSSLGWLLILSGGCIFGHAALLEEIDIAAEFV